MAGLGAAPTSTFFGSSPQKRLPVIKLKWQGVIHVDAIFQFVEKPQPVVQEALQKNHSDGWKSSWNGSQLKVYGGEEEISSWEHANTSMPEKNVFAEVGLHHILKEINDYVYQIEDLHKDLIEKSTSNIWNSIMTTSLTRKESCYTFWRLTLACSYIAWSV